MSAATEPAACLDLTGQVVLVTGASGGIGAGVVRRFAAAAATVVAGYHHNADSVAALSRESDRVTAQETDLTSEDAVAELVATVVGEHGRLDSVVNAAGRQPVTPLPRISVDEWRDVLDADLAAAHLLTRAAAEVMADGGGGSIVHVASIEATQPAVGHAHYGAAKAGLVAYARAAALEYGGRGVRVNTVSPGLVHRSGLEEQWPEGVRRWQAAAPLQRLGTPEDVANACLYLTSPLASWVTGHNLVVDGGVSAVPTW